MNTGDQITHEKHGRCTVTHIWFDWLGVVPVHGSDSEMIIIPREGAMEAGEMTRLERQARGLLDDVEVGDFVVEIKGSQLLWKVTGVRPGRMQTLPSGAQRYLWERLELKGNGFTGNVTSSKYRLATPAELLDAGVIDEIPGDDETLTNCCEAEVVVDGSWFVCGVCGGSGPESGIYDGVIYCANCGNDIGIEHYGDPGVVQCPNCRSQPRDANGEVLKVGDVVEWDGQVPPQPPSVVTSLKKGTELWTICTHDGGNDYQHHWTKLTTLTHSQYLPLARRTLDPGMTRRELLSMLTMGCVGEWGEFQRLTSWENAGDELGDLTWYASLLQDEAEEGKVEGYGFARGPSDWIEMAKKEIYHGTNKGFVKLMASCLRIKVEEHADMLGLDIGEIRYRNIRKLIDRYPDGFVSGGGRR